MALKRQKIFTISLLSVSLSASAALVPVLAQLAEVFPEHTAWIQMLITLPSLFMMFSSLLTDKLIKATSIKSTAFCSVGLILFAGVSPYWAKSFAYLIFTRMLMGIGLGFLNTAISSLPAIYFVDTTERDSAVGIQAAFASAGGVLFNLLSGFAAKYNWRYVFLIQLINLIPLLSVLWVMPDLNLPSNLEQQNTNKKIFVKNAFPVAVFAFVCITLTCTYPLNLSLFVNNNNLGDSAFVSVLTGANAAIGFFIGLIFGKTYKVLKENTLVLGLALAGAAVLGISFSTQPALLLVLSICFGIGTSFISPSLYAWLYNKVESGEIISAVALLGIASNVSQFVSPFVVNPVAAMIGSGEKARLVLAGSLILLLGLLLKVKKMNFVEQQK